MDNKKAGASFSVELRMKGMSYDESGINWTQKYTHKLSQGNELAASQPSNIVASHL